MVTVERCTFLPYNRARVFTVCSEGRHFAELARPVRVVRSEGEGTTLGQGSRLMCALPLGGLGILMDLVVQNYEKEKSFSVVQTRGPFAAWWHVLEFEDIEGGTLFQEKVSCESSLGRFGKRLDVLTLRPCLAVWLTARGRKMRALLDRTAKGK